MRIRSAACALAITLVIAGCGSGSSNSDDASPSDTTTAPEGPGEYEILDGFVSYTVPEGWDVVEDADEFESVRGDEGGPAPASAAEETQTLVELESDDGDARVVMVRDLRFLEGDVASWSEALFDSWVGDAEIVGAEVIDLPHGSGDRVDYEGAESSGIFVTSTVGEQRVAVLVEVANDADESAYEEVDEILSGLVADPEVAVPPLLHYHGAFVSSATDDGTELGEVWLDVPMGWTFTSFEGGGGGWSAPDGPGTVEVYIAPADDDARSDEWLDDIVEQYGAEFGEEVTRTTRELGGDTFEVLGLGNGDAVSLWVLTATIDDTAVDIWVVGDPDGPDEALLEAIVDSLEYHPA